MEYLLKASALVIILLLFYYVFLKSETFFTSIRSYFLIGLIVVISIPLIEVPIYVEAISSQINNIDFSNIEESQTIEANSFSWLQLLTYLYLAGVLFFSLKFLIQLISLGFLISKHKKIKQGRFYYIETNKSISPFSFFNIIIYNKSQFTIEELEHIINHEKVHAMQWHSLDTVLSHILVITLWFNPFVWLYKKAVQQNLEFIADSIALNQTKNQKLYQLTLLKTCNINYCTEITNNFYNSLIKKRIVMLHKNRSKKQSQWKYALLLPLLAAFVFTFNTKLIAQEKGVWKVKTEISDVEYIILIDKNTSDETLKQEKEKLNEEFDINLKFKGIKRNSKNEITAIKINADGKNVNASFVCSGTEPIKPIAISYNADKNSIQIGNINQKMKHFTFTVDDDVELDKKSSKKKKYVIVKKGDEKMKWIDKDSDYKEIEVEVIEKDGKKSVKVFEDGKEIDEDIEIIESDDEDKNVFIIKSDGEHIKKHKISKKGNALFLNKEGEEPLYIVNGKELSSKESNDLDPESIEKIEVFKGEIAIEKYGEKAKNGVIVITTKK